MIFNPILTGGKIKNVVLNPSYITRQDGSDNGYTVSVYSCSSDKCVAYFGVYDKSTFFGVTKDGLLFYDGARFGPRAQECTNSGMTVTIKTNGFSFSPSDPVSIIAIEA